MRVGELLQAFLETAAGELPRLDFDFQFNLFERRDPPSVKCVFVHRAEPRALWAKPRLHPHPTQI